MLTKLPCPHPFKKSMIHGWNPLLCCWIRMDHGNFIIFILGWWLTYPSEKYSSVGMIIPNIWKNKKCSKLPTRFIQIHSFYIFCSPKGFPKGSILAGLKPPSLAVDTPCFFRTRLWPKFPKAKVRRLEGSGTWDTKSHHPHRMVFSKVCERNLKYKIKELWWV